MAGSFCDCTQHCETTSGAWIDDLDTICDEECEEARYDIELECEETCDNEPECVSLCVYETTDICWQ